MMDGQTDVCMLLMRLPLEAPPRPRDQQHKAHRRLTALLWRADVVGGALPVPIRWPMSLVRYSTYISLVCSLIAQSTNRKEKRHSICSLVCGRVPFPATCPCPDQTVPAARCRDQGRDGPRGRSRSAREIRSDPTLISRREIHAQKLGTVFRRQYRLSTHVTLHTPPRSPRRRVRQDSHRSDSP